MPQRRGSEFREKLGVLSQNFVGMAGDRCKTSIGGLFDTISHLNLLCIMCIVGGLMVIFFVASSVILYSYTQLRAIFDGIIASIPMTVMLVWITYLQGLEDELT